MPTLRLECRIRAPQRACFDAARDLDLHLESMTGARERAIGGRTGGLIEEGEEVIWQARHFGLLHEHHSRITDWDPPRRFRDVMVRGRFRRFEHDHVFEDAGGGVTVMRDVLTFESPLGPLGWLVDRLVLERYLKRLLTTRNEVVRNHAEARAAAAERGVAF